MKKNRMSKLAVLSLLSLGLGLGLTAGFKPLFSSVSVYDKSAGMGTDMSGNEEGQIRLTFWNTWVHNEPWQEVMYKRIKEFEQTHKNVTINVESIPHDQYKVKVRASGAGKQLPDLFVVWPGAELRSLADGKVVKPIDDLAMEYKDKLIPEQNLTDYAVNGKQYAIPEVISYTSFIYYDKDILGKAGYAQFPATYDQFIKMISALHNMDVTPIALGNKGKWVLQSCYLSTIASRYTGDEFLTKILQGEKKFTDPDFVKALSTIRELTDLKAFNRDMNSIDNIQQQEIFIKGKAAMFIEGSWALPKLLQDFPKDRHLGIAILPSVKDGKGDRASVSGVTGQGIALNENLTGQKKQAAYQFIRHMTNEETYKELITRNTLVPATISVPEDTNESFKKMISIAGGGISPVYDAVLPSELADTINNALQEMTLNSGETPEHVAERIQKKLDGMDIIHRR